MNGHNIFNQTQRSLEPRIQTLHLIRKPKAREKLCDLLNVIYLTRCTYSFTHKNYTLSPMMSLFTVENSSMKFVPKTCAGSHSAKIPHLESFL